MSNPNDLATMRTEKGREGIAEGIYQAFKTFKGRYDGGAPVTAAPAAPVAEEKPKADPQKEEAKPAEKAQKPVAEAAPAKDGVQYGIQVLAIGKDMDLNDPYFLGYKPLVLPAGKIKKYVICTSDSLAEVKKNFPQIQKKIKDSYVVKIENGVTTPVR